MSERGCLTTIAAVSGIAASAVAIAQYAEQHDWFGWHVGGLSGATAGVWEFVTNPATVTGTFRWWAVVLWALGLLAATAVANVAAGDSIAPGAATIATLVLGAAWLWIFWASLAGWAVVAVVIVLVAVAISGYFLGEGL
jgi:hypothetical protein